MGYVGGEVECARGGSDECGLRRCDCCGERDIISEICAGCVCDVCDVCDGCDVCDVCDGWRGIILVHGAVTTN